MLKTTCTCGLVLLCLLLDCLNADVLDLLPSLMQHTIAVQKRQSSARPNFIFILADDLGYGDVGYNGGVAHTPNLDELSKGPNSVKFNYFYSGAPVCTPTRGTVLTGRNHNRYCLWKANTPGRGCNSREDFACPAQVFLPWSEVTVAEILKDQGYKTAVFGKWHLGDLKQLRGDKSRRSNPSDNGFETWKVTERSTPTVTPNCGCFNTSLCILGHNTNRGPPACTNYYTKAASSRGLLAHNESILKDDSEFIIDLFEDYLSKRDEKPFFAYLPLHGVHKLYTGAEPYTSAYKDLKLSEDEIDYYASVTAVDAAVGRVRQLLRAHNLAENTMLWFTSDNGPASRTPGLTGGLRDRKGTLYEGGIRVPGIVEYPAHIKSNIVLDTPAVTSDFLPTVCDVLKIQPPANRIMDGVSLLPYMSQEKQKRNETIKWAYNVNGNFNGRYKAAILNGKHKVVAEYKRGQLRRAALYDVRSRGGEERKKNISEHKKYMKVYDRLVTELETWRRSLMKSATEEVSCL